MIWSIQQFVASVQLGYRIELPRRNELLHYREKGNHLLNSTVPTDTLSRCKVSREIHAVKATYNTTSSASEWVLYPTLFTPII